MDIPEIDLRKITRHSDKLVTRIQLVTRSLTTIPWLIFGESNIDSRRHHRHDITARVDATDFEHDSAYALVIPLIGLVFDTMSHHTTDFEAHIDPSDPERFRVPVDSSYDPAGHPKAKMCKRCKGEDAHIIVPEGFWQPEPNHDLFKQVSGCRVLITLGPNDEEW